MKRRSFTTPLTTSLLCVVLLALLSFHASALDVDFFDSWDTDGSAYDNIVWIDNTCPVNDYAIIFGVIDNTYRPQGYCVNNNRLSDSNMDFCIVSTTSAQTNCSGIMPVAPVVSSQTSDDWAEAINVNPYQDVACGEAGNIYSNATRQLRRGQISYYCGSPSNNSCHLCGSTSSISSYNYYLINSTFNLCLSDGDDRYYTRGYYGSGTHILIEETLCSVGSVCDSDHDNVLNTNPSSSPSNPCRLEEGEECVVSSDCWQNMDCDGSHISYRGLCDGSLVDISELAYPDSCGDISASPVVDSGYLPNQDCEIDGGFSSGYVCDEDLDNLEQTSVVNVFNSVCKGGVGNACTFDSDCHHNLDCIGGFCAYYFLSLYSDNVTPNKIYVGESISFNPNNIASDDNTQFSCWVVDGVNEVCNGNATQCTSVCSGASQLSGDEDNNFIHEFGVSGNFDVVLFSGSVGLYNGTYSESYCVSGGSTFCWGCSDGVKNDDETNIDWGGHCGTPYHLRCNNNLLDVVTNETSVDYGGACGSCDNSSIFDDENLILLIETGEIVYPFTSDQCSYSDSIKYGIVIFVVLLSGLFGGLLVIIILVLALAISLFSGFIGRFIFSIAKKQVEKLRHKKKGGKQC